MFLWMILGTVFKDSISFERLLFSKTIILSSVSYDLWNTVLFVIVRMYEPNYSLLKFFELVSVADISKMPHNGTIFEVW